MNRRGENTARLNGLVQAASVSIWLVLFSVLVGCGDDKKPNTPGTDWSLGDATTYTVESSDEITVSDSVTGKSFLFPEGGHGLLKVRPIISGPEAPHEGSGFNVAFDEEVPVALIVDPTGSDQVIVMGYGTAPGLYDDIPGPSERWIAMPCVDTLESGLAFQLTLPFTGTAKIAAPNSGFSNYWISSIPAGSDDATHRVGRELQSREFIDNILDRLTPSRETAARAEVDGRLNPNYAWDGFLYSGFWWRSLGSMGRIVRPTIHLRLTADAGNVAHETGHYLTHVLVGDDVYSTLEGQAPLWDNGHGIRDDVGREMLVEDYAYFMEWLSVGSVKSYNLLDPYVIFGGISSLTRDFPGTEGFAAVALASLTRTDPTTRNLINGNADDVPVIAMSEEDVFEIIAQGATGIEDLQARITTAVGPDADKLPAMFQRIGWRHSVKGRLLTPEGQPVVGATVSSVSLVGDHVYRGGSSSIATGSDGKFMITGEVFPGDSYIRVWDGEDSTDVPITIPWSQVTNQTYDLGNLEVHHSVDLAPLKLCRIDLFTSVITSGHYGSYEAYNGPDLPWLSGSFTGGHFTGGLDTTYDDHHHVYTINAEVEVQSGKLLWVYLTKSRTDISGSSDHVESLHLRLHDIDMTSYNVYPGYYTHMECSAFEEASCNHISEYTWSDATTIEGELRTTTLTGYNCQPDHANGYVSNARVYFRSAP